MAPGRRTSCDSGVCRYHGTVAMRVQVAKPSDWFYIPPFLIPGTKEWIKAKEVGKRLREEERKTKATQPKASTRVRLTAEALARLAQQDTPPAPVTKPRKEPNV